jgi:Tfp pilus assembly protein PilF
MTLEQYISRGMDYYDKKDYDKAIADFTEIIRLWPQHEPAYYCRGLAYYDKKDYDRAIADFDHALQIEPSDQSAWVHRQNAVKARGR